MKEVHQTLQKAAREKNMLRVRFANGNVVELSHISLVDPSIYIEMDRWTGIVEAVVKSDEKFRKLFQPGSGMDFRGSDVADVGEI
jgi:hypothetical protein